MADVAMKAIAANDVKNNSMVVAVSANGTKQVKQRGDNEVVAAADMETKLTGRFDNITYYSS